METTCQMVRNLEGITREEVAGGHRGRGGGDGKRGGFQKREI